MFIMRPSSLGGGRILRRTLSVCPSVCPSVPLLFFFYFTVEPSYERTSKIEKLLLSLMGQRHVCTFRHAQRAAYRTAISAAQILVFFNCIFYTLRTSMIIANSKCVGKREVNIPARCTSVQEVHKGLSCAVSVWSVYTAYILQSGIG